MKIQRCIKCDEPTGKCEDDSLYIGDSGPYCEECFDALSRSMTARDKCPAHYCFSDLQPWDVIDAWGVDYYLGNVLKYICRAGRKSPDRLVDLNKALHYLQKEVELAEKVLAESCAFSRTQESDEMGALIKCPLCGSPNLKYDDDSELFSCGCGTVFRLDRWDEEEIMGGAMGNATGNTPLTWDTEPWPALSCAQCGEEMECVSASETTLEYYCGTCDVHMFVRLAEEDR
jgi:Zn finger protein HypA/HybF involved in hydrogenase expression